MGTSVASKMTRVLENFLLKSPGMVSLIISLDG
jgi:hypothetical protein